MKTKAKPNETVNMLLYRVFGVDDDSLQDEFYRLNPNQTSTFLEPGQMVELPTLGSDSDATTQNEIPVWT